MLIATAAFKPRQLGKLVKIPLNSTSYASPALLEPSTSV